MAQMNEAPNQDGFLLRQLKRFLSFIKTFNLFRFFSTKSAEHDAKVEQVVDEIKEILEESSVPSTQLPSKPGPNAEFSSKQLPHELQQPEAKLSSESMKKVDRELDSKFRGESSKSKHKKAAAALSIDGTDGEDSDFDDELNSDFDDELDPEFGNKDGASNRPS